MVECGITVSKRGLAQSQSIKNMHLQLMKSLISFPHLLAIILLVATSALAQNIASDLFVSDQAIFWKGKSAVQYQQTTTAFQFAATFNNPPSSISKIFTIFNGFHFLNQNRISFSSTAILNSSSPGSYSIIFTPLNSSIFYSIAFTVIGVSFTTSTLLVLDRYYLTPSTINTTPRPAGSVQETFTLNAGITLVDSGFQIRAFLSFFDSYQSSGIAGVTISPIASFTIGSTQFDVVASVQSGSQLYLCSIIIIILNKNALLVHNSQFAINGIQILQNYSTLADITLSSQTSSQFSIPAVYGPIMHRNCSIGFYGLLVNVDSSIKSVLFDYGSAATMSVLSAIGGGGVLANYQALCVIDCVSDGFYSSALQKCDFCQNYIKYCEACISATFCTDCGYNTFFNSITQHCSCKHGTRVIGGCTSIADCLSIDGNGNCLQCQTGLVLSSNSQMCLCPNGYHLAGKTCTNVAGCITAHTLSGQSKCFACNTTLNFVIDGNGGCRCGAGYTSYNGNCVTNCGNGELFGLEQCDDGNHIEGDGCSSLCQIQSSYVCNTSDTEAQSVCTYKTEFAQINLVEAYRDTDENAGYFIFTVEPAISNLNKMDFASSVNINCASRISSPIVEYSNGNLQIKIYFLENIENSKMNITLKFNQTIIIHKPVSAVFSIKSINSPMTIFTKFPQYDFINRYFKVLSVFAVVIFFAGCLVHKMIGVQTIHVFQFIFFTNIYEVAYSDLFLSSTNSLRFTSNYPDWFYNEMVSLKEGDIFQSLRFAFTFVGNYYIVGTITLVIIFVFIVNLMIKLFKNNQLLQRRQDQRQGSINQSQQTIKMDYEFKKQVIYSIAFFPIIVGYYLQCFFAVQAQLYRKSTEKSHVTQLTNSFLAIFFIWLDSLTIFRQLFYNMKYSIKSLFYNVQNRYIAIYIVNLLLNIIFFNFSDRFQYDLTSMASYNFAYFLAILFYRPYKHILHNFHILYNQTLYILWIILLIYQDRAGNKLSDSQKYIVLTTLISALSLSLLISTIRILLQVIENGFLWQKIRKYYKHEEEMANNLKKKSQKRIKNILKEDAKGMNRYFIQDQQRVINENNRQLVNAQRNALGFGDLFKSPKKKEQTMVQVEWIRQEVRMDEQLADNDDNARPLSMSTESRKQAKQNQIQQIKRKLRQNLLKYKQKKKQDQKQRQFNTVRSHF